MKNLPSKIFTKRNQRELLILLISGIISFGIALLVCIGSFMIIIQFMPSTKVLPDGTVEHYQAFVQLIISGFIALVVFIFLAILFYRGLTKRILLKLLSSGEVPSNTPDVIIVFVLIAIAYIWIIS